MRLNTTVAALAVLVVSCSPIFPDGTTVPTGSWGGEHVALEVSSTGAEVNFDCAHGTLDEPMKVDSSGNFDVKGSFTAEGGPTPLIEQSRPARYRGRLQGSALTLSVLLTDKNETAGGYSLSQGARPRLTKCK